MKPNVDLTQNRDFMKPRKPIFSSVSKLVKRLNNLDFPWSDMGIITSTLKDEEIFLTGNNESRIRKKYSKSYEEHCDKCGIELSKVPWRLEIGLCSKCDEEVSKSILKSKCPWNNI